MAICGLYDESAADAAQGDALVRMAREEHCAAWLEARGVGGGWKLAGSLADAGLGPERLDRLASMVPPEGLEEALCWLEARARVAMLSRTAADAAARVADVVQAVKGYTLLGQAPLLEVDLAEALESTLAVLRPRLASIVVETEFGEGVPPVRAWGGELNQVWTALLENAADALHDGGHLVVRTAREGDELVRVEIEDDGPGIAPEIQGRVFDAFFTTRDVGQGVGLGLTGAYRIVSEHGGTIAFRSRPGQTVFEVRIPVDPPIPTG